MKKSSSHSSSSSSSSSGKFWSLAIWIFILFVLLFWIITTRLLISDSASSPQIDTTQLHRLYEETRSLMKDIVACNSSKSDQLISKISSDQAFYDREIERLSEEKVKFEVKYSQCLTAKHALTEQVEHCESKVHSAPNHHDAMNVPSVVSAPVVSTESKSTTGLPWLVIGMPTLARPNQEDYLLRTLASIDAQLPKDDSDLLYRQVVVAVVHVQPDSPHSRFDEAKALYGNNPHFSFDALLPTELYPDVKALATPANDPGNANVPGYRVRKQTRNLAAVVQKVASKGRYYLFLEDDMEFCHESWLVFQYLLHKASIQHPRWLAIRASYGMNGIFMPSVDALVFAKYLLKHQIRRPPDHLVVEWFAGETEEARMHKQHRPNLGFRYNLFHHIGSVSSLRSQKSGRFPECYDLLVEPTVFKVEAFNVHECPHEDLWPCTSNARGMKIPPRLKWENIH